MSKRLTVKKDQVPIYDIVMESSFLQLKIELEQLGAAGRRLCVVTDTKIAPLYEKEVTALLKGCAKTVLSFVFPTGEAYKTLDTVKNLYQVLIEAKFDRKDLLVALGGGVVGDLTGFTAATYLRGIDFIQIPTTLLAQVDSSVGGKTGVDFDGYKNMIGAFCMPKLVYMNLSVLHTLEQRIYCSGMGEVIKYGFIMDPSFYTWLLSHTDEIKTKDLAAMEHMIYVSCDKKREIVEKDPFEHSVRAWLNFGHTLGHAIEKKKEFSLYHGECVALGMMAAAYISKQRGFLSDRDLDTLKRLLIDFDLPVSVCGLSVSEVIAATKNDKKMEQGNIKFVLLKSVGEAFLDYGVTDGEMEEALRFIGLNG